MKMSRIKIFVESQDEKTWEEICDDVATGKTNYIDFKGVVFNRVKHGHWIYERLTNTNGGSYSVVWCSNCQAHIPWVTKYCPYCGAKMDEVEDGN